MAKKVYKTARGVQFDMEHFSQTHHDKVALGNLGGHKAVNAKGDILGQGGKIEVPRESVVQEYYKKELPVQKTASIKDNFTSSGPSYDESTVDFKSPEEVLNDYTTYEDRQKKATKKKGQK